MHPALPILSCRLSRSLPLWLIVARKVSFSFYYSYYLSIVLWTLTIEKQHFIVHGVNSIGGWTRGDARWKYSSELYFASQRGFGISFNLKWKHHIILNPNFGPNQISGHISSLVCAHHQWLIFTLKMSFFKCIRTQVHSSKNEISVQFPIIKIKLTKKWNFCYLQSLNSCGELLWVHFFKPRLINVFIEVLAEQISYSKIFVLPHQL